MDEKLDIVMLHIGSNDINYRNVEDINVNTIVDGTIRFAQKYSTSGVRNVDISSIFLKS